MNKSSARKGDNIVEYAIILAFVGLIFGVALLHLNPNVFKNYFNTTFNGSQTQQNNTYVYGPLSN